MSVAAGFALCVDLSRDERGKAVYLVGHMCYVV
jgi:hypothetical protein